MYIETLTPSRGPDNIIKELLSHTGKDRYVKLHLNLIYLPFHILQSCCLFQCCWLLCYVCINWSFSPWPSPYFLKRYKDLEHGILRGDTAAAFWFGSPGYWGNQLGKWSTSPLFQKTLLWMWVMSGVKIWKDCANTKTEFSQVFCIVSLNKRLSTQMKLTPQKWIFQIPGSIFPSFQADYSSYPRRFWGR